MYQVPPESPTSSLASLPEQPDEELVKLAQRRDPAHMAQTQQAFNVLQLRYELLIIRHLRRIVDNPETAAELAQEAFLAAWLKLPTLREAQHFRAWLYRIATNLAYGFLRGKRPLIVSLYIFVEQDESGAPRERYPEPLVAPSQEEMIADLDRVRQALARLPKMYRICLLMFAQDGLSQKEIGEVLGIDTHTVSSNINRARAVLQRILQEEDRKGATE